MTDFVPSEDRKNIYAATRQDLLSRNLSNAERYDNAILTLSAGLLGISLAFIKDIVPLKTAEHILLLKISWCLFGAAIVSTLISFAISQFAIKRQLEYAEKYYLEGKEEYLNKKNTPATLTDYVNYVSGLLFLAGIVATVWFVSSNIKGGSPMSQDEKHFTKDGAPVPKLQGVATPSEEHLLGGAPIPKLQSLSSNTEQHLHEGAPVLGLQKIQNDPNTVEKGAPIPALQPVISPKPTDNAPGTPPHNTEKK